MPKKRGSAIGGVKAGVLKEALKGSGIGRTRGRDCEIFTLYKKNTVIQNLQNSSHVLRQG